MSSVVPFSAFSFRTANAPSALDFFPYLSNAPHANNRIEWLLFTVVFYVLFCCNQLVACGPYIFGANFHSKRQVHQILWHAGHTRVHSLNNWKKKCPKKPNAIKLNNIWNLSTDSMIKFHCRLMHRIDKKHTHTRTNVDGIHKQRHFNSVFNILFLWHFLIFEYVVNF